MATLTGDDRPEAYGDAFADVYDEWYDTVSDAEATASFLSVRCTDGPVVELGVGTGRIAEPLTRLGHDVIGVDASSAMLARCRQRCGSSTLLVRADLGTLPLTGPLGGALCGFNTLFNLRSPARQQELFGRVADALGPSSPLVIEAMTGTALAGAPARSFGISRRDRERVVVAATTVDHDEQLIVGRHLDIDRRGTAERRWSLRWTTPTQLDMLAAVAGLELRERYRSWGGEPFGDDSETHVSVYRRS